MAHSKLILAVLQGEDYGDVVRQLNENGIFVTILHSTGGFLRKRSVTIMIGVEEAKLEQVLDLPTDGYSLPKSRLHAAPARAAAAVCLHPHGSLPRRCCRLRAGPGTSGKILISSSSN